MCSPTLEEASEDQRDRHGKVHALARTSRHWVYEAEATATDSVSTAPMQASWLQEALALVDVQLREAGALWPWPFVGALLVYERHARRVVLDHRPERLMGEGAVQVWV